MGCPCKKCPTTTTVQSCCGLRNLRVASLLIGFFKVILFLSAMIGAIAAINGNSGNKQTDKLSTGHLVVMMLMSIGFIFLAVVLLAGIFKKRRTYVMVYWVSNLVWIVLTLVGLFTQSQEAAQVVICIVYLAMDIYFQIVIRSHYLEMSGAADTTSQTSDPSNPVNRY